MVFTGRSKFFKVKDFVQGNLNFSNPDQSWALARNILLVTIFQFQSLSFLPPFGLDVLDDEVSNQNREYGKKSNPFLTNF